MRRLKNDLAQQVPQRDGPGTDLQGGDQRGEDAATLPRNPQPRPGRSLPELDKLLAAREPAEPADEICDEPGRLRLVPVGEVGKFASVHVETRTFSVRPGRSRRGCQLQCARGLGAATTLGMTGE